jgi:hypothetical protein
MKTNRWWLATLLASVLGTLSVLATCEVYDLVSHGKCGPAIPLTCPTCHVVSCPNDWSCTGGTSWYQCDDSQTYTATCSQSWGFAVYTPIFHICGCSMMPGGSVPGSLCHQGVVMKCQHG